MLRTRALAVRNRRLSRSSLAVQVEALETRVPVSEGIGPFLAVSVLAAASEPSDAAALAPPPQAAQLDRISDNHAFQTSRIALLGTELSRPRPVEGSPLVIPRVTDLPAATFATNEDSFFDALAGVPFDTRRLVPQTLLKLESAVESSSGPAGSAAPEQQPAALPPNPVTFLVPVTGSDEERLAVAAGLVAARNRYGSDGHPRLDQFRGDRVSTVPVKRLSDQGPGTAGIPYLPVQLTYSPVFPIAARPLAGQPFTYDMTAAVDENVVPLTPCKLYEPTWQWGVSAGFSENPTGPFQEPQPGTWSHSLSSAYSPATSVTLVGEVQGYWEFIVGVAVEFRDDCGNVWNGGDNLTLKESTFAAAAPPFKIESKPDTAVAIRNDYVEQIETAEVLRGWQVRYTAPLAAGATRWQFRRVGETDWRWLEDAKGIIEANPAEIHELAVGEFEVRFARREGFDQFSDARRIRVIEPQVREFVFAVGGPYVKSGFHVLSPLNGAMAFTGNVDKTAESPSAGKIRWGFVQSVERTGEATLNWTRIAWHQQSPNGTTVRFPPRYFNRNPPSAKNDDAVGRQLYNQNPAGWPLLDQRSGSQSTPFFPNARRDPMIDSSRRLANIVYDRNEHSRFDYVFNVWLVAFNVETQQYQPLRQRAWTLRYDTRDDGPWTAEIGQEPPTMSRPTEATNSIILFNIPQRAPSITITKPQDRP